MLLWKKIRKKWKERGKDEARREEEVREGGGGEKVKKEGRKRRITVCFRE